MKPSVKIANDGLKTRLTLLVFIRRTIFVFAGIISLIALIISALPWAVSTQLIRNRIAVELGEWSGFKVVITSPPQIQILLSPRAVLTGVKLYQKSESEGNSTLREPLLEIEKLELHLSPLSALRGTVLFTQARMINPILRISLKKNKQDFIALRERFAKTIQKKNNIFTKEKAYPLNQHMMPLSVFEFNNGRILFLDHEVEKNSITEVSGQIEWPSLDSSFRLSLKSSWNNEKVQIILQAPSPLLLLAGEKQTISIDLVSRPIHASFLGSISLWDKEFINGNIESKIPSIQHAIYWSHIPLATDPTPSKLSFSGKLSGESHFLTFHGKTQIDSDVANGNLSISFLDQLPFVSGSLSFITFDIKNFLSLFTPLGLYDPLHLSSLANQVNFNLQVKADQAKIHSLPVSNLEGRVFIKNKLAEFDMQKSSVFNGTAQAKLRFNNQNKQSFFQVNFDTKNIDGSLLGKALNLRHIFPESKGNISGLFSSIGIPFDTMFGRCDGIITANFGKGKLNSLDLMAFLEKAKTGGFFPLSEISLGSILVDNAEFKVFLRNGIGRIKKAELTSNQRTILLSGVMPYPGRSLALSGSVYTREKVSTLNPGGREISFFVGGSWDSPFISVTPLD